MAKRAKKEDNIDLNAWMNTYCDMVTLLLCFFVLLVASSEQDVAKIQAIATYFNPTISILSSGQTVNEGIMVGNGISVMPSNEAIEEAVVVDEETKKKMEESEELEKIAFDFKTYFEENKVADKVEITKEFDYVNIRFKDGVLFDKSKDILKEEALVILNLLADELAKYPDMEIQIEGHADSDQINTIQFPSNWHLSAARAISVARYYIYEKGFSPDQIAAIGYGESRPIATNDTVEGKALNRRVEIKLYKGSKEEVVQ